MNTSYLMSGGTAASGSVSCFNFPLGRELQRLLDSGLDSGVATNLMICYRLDRLTAAVEFSRPGWSE